MERLVIYAADIGSIKQKRFGWARLEYGANNCTTDICIQNLTYYISEDLAKGFNISLGFECPLFLDLPKDPEKLTSARNGEGSRAWSAGAALLRLGITNDVSMLSQQCLVIKA